MRESKRLADDIDDEIADHIDRRTRELQQNGLSDDDARAQATREFGSLRDARRALMRIDTRMAHRRRPRVFAGLWQDAHHAVRRGMRQPAATMLMVATLAIGLGVATAVFTVVDQRIFRDPPFLHGDRLVIAYDLNGPSGGGGNSMFPQKIVGWQQQPAVFERFEAYAPIQLEVRRSETAGDDEPDRVMALVASVGLFDMLGIKPRIGRGFTGGDGVPGGENVTVLGHEFWTSRFGGDPGVLGSRITLNEDPYTVVGVMPPNVGLMNDEQPLWIPMDMPSWGATNPRLGFFGVGRLRQGLTAIDAQTAADEIAGSLQTQTPLARSWYLGINEMKVANVPAAGRTTLFVLLAAVGALLVIACVNVTNLLAGQALTRRAEMELQSALGASRWRLVRQVLVEGLLIAAVSAGAALLLAQGVLDAVMALTPEDFAYSAKVPIALDLRVLVIGGVVAVAAGLLVALWPAWRATTLAGSPRLRAAGRGSTQGRSLGRVSGALVVIEVALAMVLLTGAVLLARTLVNLYAVDPRFDVDRLVAIDVPLPVDRYPTELTRRAFFDELDVALRQQPGIEQSSYAWAIPPDSGGFSIGVPESDAGSGGEEVHLPLNRVSASYFATTGIPILEGRTFDSHDTLDEIIVSESLARTYWPDDSAVGRRFRQDSDRDWLTVVGVVGDVTTALGEHRTEFMVYEPFDATPPASAPRQAPSTPVLKGPTQRVYANRTLVVRANDPAAAVPLIRERILAVDSRQTIEDVELAADAYAKPFAEQRFLMRVMGAFALCALVMVAAGIIGLLLQTVAQRRREIGIRVALGASPSSVIHLIVSRAGLLAALGAAAGIAASTAGARYLESLLFGVTPHDIVSLVLVAAVLWTTAAVACWWPVRRALLVDPAEVLRSE